MNSTATAVGTDIDIDGDEIVEGIVKWLEMESPTLDVEAVNAMVDTAQADFEAAGLTTRRTPGEDGYGDLLEGFGPGAGPSEARGNEPGILVLSHIDTVHPIGTKSDGNPIRREGDKLYGPGVYDMKAGAYMAFDAYRRLLSAGGKTQLPVRFMFIPEEERGSPYSRKYIKQAAGNTKFALVTEPARDGGKVVIARKGSARFKLKIIGRPSHSGSKHEEGRSAIREMARQICDIEDMTDYDKGLTFNAGFIEGGTAPNVVPQECRLELDCRFVRLTDGEAAVETIYNLKPYDPDVRIEVSGGLSRPPMEKERNEELFEMARGYGAEHGLDLQYTPLTGGGSDGNIICAEGVPTLDGLGADGEGAHTLFENILVSSLEPRSRMWIKMFEGLK
ncbi:MAG: M20 family metallopeptidase [Rhodospirillaceae bacterium]|nr:M20 family metallopeptidase [Rhodospirillaceae bacterium]